MTKSPKKQNTAYDATISDETKELLYNALVETKAGHIDKAIELYTEATQTDTTGLVWLKKGYLEFSHGKIKESILSFEHAAQYNQVKAKHILGLHYLMQWEKKGIRDNLKTSHKWLCEASCEGNKESQDEITYNIFNGKIPWQKSCLAITGMKCQTDEVNHNLSGASAELSTDL